MSDGRPYPQAPALGVAAAIALFLVNLAVIPGLGTLLGSVIAGERGIAKGIVQFLLAFLIIGYIWAIVTGIQMLINASWKSKQTA